MLIPENREKGDPSDEAYLSFPLWGFRVVVLNIFYWKGKD